MNILIVSILAAPLLAGGSDTEKEAKKAVEDFRSVYFLKSTTDADRIASIQNLAKIPHMNTARMLGKLLFIAPDAHRITAALALGDFYEVRGASALAAGALMARCNKDKTTLRVALVQTLGSLRQTAVLPLLHHLVEKDDFIVAKAVIEVIPSFERRESIPLLIKYLRKCERKPDNFTMNLNIGDLCNLDKLKDQTGMGGGSVSGLGAEGQMDFKVKINADEKQGLRNRLCYPALKKALRELTGHYLPDWKSWNQWWRSGGAHAQRR